MTLIQRAQNFAHAAHDSIGQKRKYTGEPYWVHTDEVARIVEEAVYEQKGIWPSQKMIAAANLHDVLEDVFPVNPNINHQKIKNEFGDDVYLLVSELTDEFTKEKYPKWNRETRKRAEAARIEKISIEAKTIKLADLISNTASIVEHDPDFAKTYLKEKFNLLGALSDGNPVLLERATKLCVEGMKKLGLTIPMIVAR